jgi:hypothetical protein
LKLVTKDTIEEAIKKQLKTYTTPKAVSFFKDIEQRLLKEIMEEEEVVTVSIQDTDIKRGKINPDLKNTITRLVNIDSSYRVTTATSTTDNYSLILSEPLLNVISISLYSIEVPQSWYTFTIVKGTCAFMVNVILNRKDVVVTFDVIIDEGNYTPTSLITEVVSKLTVAFDDAASQLLIPPITVTSEYNASNGKLTLIFTPPPIPEGAPPPPPPPPGAPPDELPSESDDRVGGDNIYTIQLVWLDETNTNTNMVYNRVNVNLGWILGYRIPVVNCLRLASKTQESFIAPATSLIDTSGTKYIILSLEDYKTNRLNRSIVSINNVPQSTISMPTYFTNNIPQYRVSPTKVKVVNSNPRQLTSKQLYTINSISQQVLPKNTIINVDTNSNAFAKIALKKNDWCKTAADGTSEVIDNGPGKLFIENGGPLSLQMRDYFGPVDLLNLSITLYDDKGNILGLNSMDWSFSLMVKCIYEY